MHQQVTTSDFSGMRRGTVVVTVAVSLTVIMGIVALALDGGLLLDKRRQAQCASDAAALAGSSELYANWWANGVAYQGLDPTGTARNAALAAAQANGFRNGVSGCTVTVNIPPQSGRFSGVRGHVEVIIQHEQPRYFSSIFGSGNIQYTARAVARGLRSSIQYAIICLDPSGRGALNAGGNGSVTVMGAPIQVNSSDYSAMIANGNGTMIADKFLVGGNPGWSTPGGGSFSGTVVPNSPPLPDPLAFLPAPDINTLTVQSTNKTSISGNRTVNLRPGVYYGGIAISGGTVNLDPGIYYMKGGGINLGGQGNLYGTGVLIYNDPGSNSDTINLSGGGNCVLSPMTSGPYQGVLLFQNRTSTAPVSVSGSAGANFTITGTFYAASAVLNVTGNGTQQTLGSQYISYDLVLGGNGTYYCSWTADKTPGIREILLVE